MTLLSPGESINQAGVLWSSDHELMTSDHPGGFDRGKKVTKWRTSKSRILIAITYKQLMAEQTFKACFLVHVAAAAERSK